MPILDGVRCRCESTVEVATVVGTACGDITIGWRVYCTGGTRWPMRRALLGTVWLPLQSGEDVVAKGWEPLIVAEIKTAISRHQGHVEQSELRTFSFKLVRAELEEQVHA